MGSLEENFLRCDVRVLFLKLTDSSHLEMDGWNTNSFPFWGIFAYFQGLCIISFRECIPSAIHSTYYLREKVPF